MLTRRRCGDRRRRSATPSGDWNAYDTAGSARTASARLPRVGRARQSHHLIGGLQREGAAAPRPVPGHVLPVLPARAGADGRDIRPPAIARRRLAGHRRHRTRQCAPVLQVQADASGNRRRSAADDPPLVWRAPAGADAAADADDEQHLHQPHRRAAGAAVDASRQRRAHRARRLSEHADRSAGIRIDVHADEGPVPHRPRGHRSVDPHRVRQRGPRRDGQIPSHDELLGAASIVIGGSTALGS